jgi:hypothetical protein
MTTNRYIICRQRAGLAFVVIFSKRPAGHALKTPAVGNCNTVVSMIILWDRRRTCGPSLTETSLCGAYL